MLTPARFPRDYNEIARHLDEVEAKLDAQKSAAQPITPDSLLTNRAVSTIEPRTFLTEGQQRYVKAVFAMLGLDQRAFAEEEGISYTRLNRMINGAEIVTPSYAKKLNRLLARAPFPQSVAA